MGRGRGASKAVDSHGCNLPFLKKDLAPFCSVGTADFCLLTTPDSFLSAPGRSFSNADLQSLLLGLVLTDLSSLVSYLPLPTRPTCLQSLPAPRRCLRAWAQAASSARNVPSPFLGIHTCSVPAAPPHIGLLVPLLVASHRPLNEPAS